VRSAVIVGPIAATTEYWEETQADGTRESGCRVQLRRVRETKPPVPPPQPRRDAVFWSIEDPIWRADLFTTVGSDTAFDAAHYHPTFAGLVPCDRVGDPAIEADPYAWIEGRLADVPAMLTEAGYPELAADLDLDALRQAMPAILATIRTTLGFRPGATART
jgi:hypothetical protein